MKTAAALAALVFACGEIYGCGWSDTPVTLYGGPGDDDLRGGDGIDMLEGHSGDDFLVGCGGDDVLIGDDGDDRLWGESGNDALRGGDGNDTLEGHSGDDMLHGGDGDDILFGGEGNDILFGDDGDDRFRIVSVWLGVASQITIEDFTRGEDEISFSAGGVGWEDLDIVQGQHGAVISGFTLVRDAGGDFLLESARGHTITLTGVDAAALTAADFGLDG